MPDPVAAAAEASTPTRGRRLRWLIPLLVVLVWLAFGGAFGSYAGKLSEVQTNDNASFLPESAESTQVVEIQDRFTEEDVLPAVVVYEYDSPINIAELDRVGAEAQRFATLEGVRGQPGPPVPSDDGLAVQVVVPVDATDGLRIGETVERIRDVVGEEAGGTPYVTGPAGILSDFVEAFGEIDGLLILVALSVVLVILLIVYRSPILPFIVLLSAVFALGLASAAVYFLADNDVITLNGQSQGILFILVVGAATDYALLLVSRYREELREYESRYDAIRAAIRGTREPILASGVTVILAVLCLLFSELNSNRGLGPVASIGIAFAMLAALTFLPAMLVLLGRRAFWPFRPRFGSAHPQASGIWGRVGRMVGRRPRLVWAVTALALAAAAAFVPQLKADGVPQTDFFLTEVESVTGQEALSRHFAAGTGSPAIIAGPAEDLTDIVGTARKVDGVADAAPLIAGPPGPDAEPLVVDDTVLVQATLTDQADSPAAEETVRELRAALDRVGDDVLVGGTTAIQIDTLDASVRDRNTIIPIVLIVIFLVLALLLRALVAPTVLLVANVLSFLATLGISAIVFNWVFDFPGADPAVPLYAFIFLVALGIDYSIFLMTRVREESHRIGTRPGIVRGLTVTGGVITSAGIVLAATFSALSVLPLLFLAQIAFLVAFGVLLDTFVVRSLLVPAVSYDIGRATWWPGRLARAPQPTSPGAEPESVPR